MLRYLSHVPRILLGLMFVATGIAGLYGVATGVDPLKPPLPPAVAGFTDPMEHFAAFWGLMKALQLVGGVALLSNRFAPLGAVILAPIVLTIVMTDAFLAHDYPKMLVIGLLEAWLLWSYRANYAGVFAPPRR